MLKTRCPECGQKVSAPDNMAGKAGKCPKCAARVEFAAEARSPVAEQQEKAAPGGTENAPMSLGESLKQLFNGPVFKRREPGPLTPAEKFLLLVVGVPFLILVIVLIIHWNTPKEVPDEVYVRRAVGTIKSLHLSYECLRMFGLTDRRIASDGSFVQRELLMNQIKHVADAGKHLETEKKWLEGVKPPPGFEKVHENLIKSCEATHMMWFLLAHPDCNGRDENGALHSTHYETVGALCFVLARGDAVWARFPDVSLPGRLSRKDNKRIANYKKGYATGLLPFRDMGRKFLKDNEVDTRVAVCKKKSPETWCEPGFEEGFRDGLWNRSPKYK